MVKAGEDLRLPLETSEAVRISRKRFRQERQCDLAAQLRVGGLPLFAHAVFADQGGDVVMAESVADVQRHS